MFPRLGHFLFWLLWPYIVARQTRSHYLKYTGIAMPAEQEKALTNALKGVKEAAVQSRADRAGSRR